MSENEKKNIEVWDETKFYDAEIVPLLNQIVEKCESRNIPHLLHFQYVRDEESIGCGLINNVCLKTRGKTSHAANMIVCASILDGKSDFIPVPKEFLGPLGYLLKDAVKENKED